MGVYARTLPSFRPETAIFPNLYVNQRPCTCDVQKYASAQDLDLLDLGKNISFPNRKPLRAYQTFQDGHYLKVVVAIAAFEQTLRQATLLETGGPSHRGKGRCGPVSLPVPCRRGPRGGHA